MEKLEKNIELAKDVFVTYCAKRFKNDMAVQDYVKDIAYLEFKKQVFIDSKKRRANELSFKMSKLELAQKLKEMNMENLNLPSKYQIDDIINVNFGNSNYLKSCQIAAVKFTNEGKILYDIEVHIIGFDNTTIENIDSAFIEPID